MTDEPDEDVAGTVGTPDQTLDLEFFSCFLFTGPGHLEEAKYFYTYEAARRAANEYRQQHGGTWTRWQTDVTVAEGGADSKVLKSVTRTKRTVNDLDASGRFKLYRRALIIIERSTVQWAGPLTTGDVSHG